MPAPVILAGYSGRSKEAAPRAIGCRWHVSNLDRYAYAVSILAQRRR